MIILQNEEHPVVQYVKAIDVTELVLDLCSSGSLDLTCGNYRIDKGYASAKCQCWDSPLGFMTKPELLNRTTQPIFTKTMLEPTITMDMVCQLFSMELCHWVDGINNDWARKITPDNVFQVARNSLALSDKAFGGRLDSQNDPWDLMSPVPVIHKIVPTADGYACLEKIGYLRKACYESGFQTNKILPMIIWVCQ
jgi:hypothetical protein